MDKLTFVEQKYYEFWKKEIPVMRKENEINQNMLDLVRIQIKSTAYHEAGHAAVNSFFGEEYTHFRCLTIIPNQKYMGSFSHDRGSNIMATREKIYTNMSMKLAGRLAEKQLLGESGMIEDEIEEKLWLEEYVEENAVLDDLTGALRLAEGIAVKGWPPLRILKMVEAWTEDLLKSPVVWGVVEKLAYRLMDVGEINDFEEFESIVGPIVFKSFGSPEWKRRLCKLTYLSEPFQLP